MVEILDQVSKSVPNLWICDFTESTAPSDRRTSDVRTAVWWRNEGRTPLLIVGDLNRNRARGLANIAQVSASEVRGRIFDALTDGAASDFSAQIKPLLRSLRSWDLPLDMVASYCASLIPLGAGSGDQARRELWRLGFLPDLSFSKIERSRLRLNQQTVDRIRSSDLAELQRLVSSSAPSYSVLRRFARTNDLQLLARLNLDDVIEAVSQSRRRQPGRTASKPKPAPEPSRAPDLVDLVLANEVAEEALLTAVQSQSGQTLEVGGDRLAWSGSTISDVLDDPSISETSPSADVLKTTDHPTPDPRHGDNAVELAGSDGGSLTYSEDPPINWQAEFYSQVAGGVKEKGSVHWAELRKFVELIEELALDAPAAAADALAAFQQIANARAELSPYAGSIPSEGVRLFFASESLLRQADSLVAGWNELWDALRQMRDDLPSDVRTEVRRIANELTLFDLVVESPPDGVQARLLPLHPAVVEPRARAARLFLRESKSGEVDAEFVDTVSVNLDPAAPSIGIVYENTPEALAFAGIHSTGLPIYAKRRLASGTEETVRLTRQLIDRFVAVHPFAEVSFSVALVNPTAAVVARLYQAYAHDPKGRFERIRIRVFAQTGAAEVREDVAKAAASDVDEPTNSIFIDVIEGSPSPESLRAGGSPHLLVMFNVSHKGDATFGALWESPQQGSVVSEWKFVPLRRMTVIKPSPSGPLAALLNKQAELAAGGQAELQRSPLLRDRDEADLAALGTEATWLVLVEATSALAAPEKLDGRLDLFGRLGSGAHIAYVYGHSPRLLVQPPLSMLQGNSWLDPEPDALLAFLTTTVQRALPEGLLGFFGSGGAFRDDAVLGRVGVAAVLADLQDRDNDTLVVSLDTETASQWLQRRPTNKRADLLSFSWPDGRPRVEAIEVKATKDLHPDRIPGPVFEAAKQVREMLDVLRGIFGESNGDPFAASRREILKRQVFLEALQQWDTLRVDNWEIYRQRVLRLNSAFELTGTSVQVAGRVVVVGPDAPKGPYPSHVGEDELPLEVLGGEWLRRALRHGRSYTAIPAELGDLLPPMVNVNADFPPSGASNPERNGDLRVPVDHSGSKTDDRAPAAEATAEKLRADHLNSTSSAREALARRVAGALHARQVPVRRLDPADITEGPSVVRVPFELEVGARLAALSSQEADLARDLGVPTIRVDNLIGRARYAVLELPREDRIIADVLSLTKQSGPATSIALGSDLDFAPFWLQLSDLPHLLIGGTTGSGKSMLIRSILWQLTRLYGPNDLDLVLIDAKGMNDYRDLARAPQIRSSTDYHLGATGALDLLLDIVDRRLPERVAEFNRYAEEALGRPQPQMFTDIISLAKDALDRGLRPPMRPFVVVIDEFAELALSTSDKRRFETLVTRFVQRARAVGGHLIAATQRPSVEIVPGVMKANFARVSLRVQSTVDSRVVLDSPGAEMLLPRGDMLYASPELGLVRLQGFAAHGPYPPVV
ncbi:DNA translocase FtsK [Plantactinospora sp. B5E13]|uniref:DNA translocase FtsK n=1 Tax=Plantactinospora sp. B5E13 TaxID=3153758 RepID=UPI00325D0E28